MEFNLKILKKCNWTSQILSRVVLVALRRVNPLFNPTSVSRLKSRIRIHLKTCQLPVKAFHAMSGFKTQCTPNCYVMVSLKRQRAEFQDGIFIGQVFSTFTCCSNQNYYMVGLCGTQRWKVWILALIRGDFRNPWWKPSVYRGDELLTT